MPWVYIDYLLISSMERSIDIGRLRGIRVSGRILYTDAADTQALLRAGFAYSGDTDFLSPPGEEGTSFRYQEPNRDDLVFDRWDPRIRTRVDFVSTQERSDVIHDVAKALLEAGHLVIAPCNYASLQDYDDQLAEVITGTPPAVL